MGRSARARAVRTVAAVTGLAPPGIPTLQPHLHYRLSNRLGQVIHVPGSTLIDLVQRFPDRLAGWRLS